MDQAVDESHGPDGRLFRGVPQFEVVSEGERFRFPTFFRDVLHFQVSFAAPLEALAGLLPSRALRPAPVFPGRGLLTVGAFRYRETDIGDYEEVSFTVPVAFASERSLLPDVASTWLGGPAVYVWQLPVTTGRSLRDGREFYGLPKFIADVDIGVGGGWFHCRLKEAGELILDLSVRQRTPRPAGRLVVQLVSQREGHLLTSTALVSQGERALTVFPGDVRLRLGRHRLAETMRRLPLGRPLAALSFPCLQMVLSSPLASRSA